MRRICVFLGSNPGTNPHYLAATRALGTEIARRGLTTVYGGSNVGLMGQLADSALKAGGEVIGIIPEALRDKELAHQGLTSLKVVSSMHERKALMAELADGFIALPGGLGTLEELCEVLTWAQLGFHKKPCGLLDVDGYYAPLCAFLDHAVVEGFVMAAHRGMLLSDADPAALLDRFANYQAPTVTKWVTKPQAL
ncbi:MAG: TIGR00730 family Rossman fold protein [Humidesulfovibrio sp.]|uniref:LOG family protein n=1 Tax=Humidesulfovibrio sp. TaxID=2910988 RepID=UPI0027F0B78F|nr:TIGR00730 family Rossman fold protein [Humidesulfovibrio sp.]MDQ7836219.1 TIGR00730 family Rossman fold protein [Humidesulfovibrio sp.]